MRTSGLLKSSEVVNELKSTLHVGREGMETLQWAKTGSQEEHAVG
jgi:hypothetical protein